ncbi:PD-(D/E)XK nuclease superfamily protein [Anabaena sp. PCC 7108]|uniref:PD-(D/E)XK nuclease superfamily protein n=1 Tax=Anabaena sp. PCC 7108 TaxID=163908 RepID=UPI00034AC1C5
MEKRLHHLNLNIQDCYPAAAIVLIDGGGMKPQAISWLTKQVGYNQNLLAVHNLSSFIAWSNNHI